MKGTPGIVAGDGECIDAQPAVPVDELTRTYQLGYSVCHSDPAFAAKIYRQVVDRSDRDSDLHSRASMRLDALEDALRDPRHPEVAKAACDQAGRWMRPTELAVTRSEPEAVAPTAAVGSALSGQQVGRVCGPGRIASSGVISSSGGTASFEGCDESALVVGRVRGPAPVAYGIVTPAVQASIDSRRGPGPVQGAAPGEAALPVAATPPGVAARDPVEANGGGTAACGDWTGFPGGAGLRSRGPDEGGEFAPPPLIRLDDLSTVVAPPLVAVPEPAVSRPPLVAAVNPAPRPPMRVRYVQRDPGPDLFAAVFGFAPLVRIEVPVPVQHPPEHGSGPATRR